ncbi:MAG: type VII toxin-antitoxin system MntA family adenylyltransferase antitoxin [bacterium]
MCIESLDEVLKSYDFIDFALLFGSYARGTQKNLSDIDIAIYTNRSIGLLEQGDIISFLEDKFEKKIDLVLLNNLEKENAKMAFNIVNNHKIIFSRQKQKYIDFKANTYKYYLDLQPMYEMFDEALKERISSGTYGKA